MELSLSIWKPLDASKPIRKTYKKGIKQDLRFSFEWREVKSYSNDELSLDTIAKILREIKEKDRNLCIGSHSPIQGTENCFQRKGANLQIEKRNWILLDCDEEYPEVSPDMDIDARVKVMECKEPILEGLGMVSCYSSSGLVDNPEKPGRTSLHIFVMLDKPYSRHVIKNFLDTHKKSFDKALATPTQPHIVAMPNLEDTPNIREGEDLVRVRYGKKLNLDKYEYTRPKTNVEGSKEISNLPREYSKLKESLLKKLRGREEGADRWSLFNKLIERDVNDNNGQVSEELRYILKDKIILGNRDETHIDTQINYYQGRWLRSKIYWKNWHKYEDTYSFLEDLSETTDYEMPYLEGIDNEIKQIFKDRFMGTNEYDYWDYEEIIEEDLAHYKDIEKVPGEGVIVLKSGCGTGKTKGWIKRWIECNQFKRVLYVTRYKGTIDPFCDMMKSEGFNFTNYQTIGGSEPSDFFLKPYLATTEITLQKLFKNAEWMPYEALIIDEAEKVPEGGMMNIAWMAECLEIASSEAQATLLMDADITDRVSSCLVHHLAENKAKRAKLYKNTFDYMNGMNVYRNKSQYQIMQKILNLGRQGKHLYIHIDFNDDLKKASGLKSFLIEKLPDAHIDMFVSGQECDDFKEIKRDAEGYINKRFRGNKQYILINSPWSIVGWDYPPCEDKFDHTFGIYPGRHISAFSIAQGMRRPRLTGEHSVFIGGKKEHRWKTELIEAREDAVEGYEKIKKSFSKEIQDILTEKGVDEKSNICLHFSMIMEERGAKQIFEDVPIEDISIIKEIDSWEEDELQFEAFNIQSNPEKLERFEKDFKFEPDCDCPSEFISPNGSCEIHRKGWSVEEIKELYLRRGKVRTSDIGDLLEIWRQSEKERLTFNRDDNYKAFHKGALLDHIDSMIGIYGLKKGGCFLDFIHEAKTKSIELHITDEKMRILKTLIQKVNQSGDVDGVWRHKRAKDFLNAFFKSFDIETKWSGKLDKKEPKKEIIQEYKENGLLKGISKVGEKIEVIKDAILVKCRGGVKLTEKEKNWIITDSYILTLVKHDVRLAPLEKEFSYSREKNQRKIQGACQ